MTASPTPPPDIGQQSIERLCASHPLALARLKELMRDAERWRKVRAQNGYVLHSDPVICDSEVDALEAIAEGGR